MVGVDKRAEGLERAEIAARIMEEASGITVCKSSDCYDATVNRSAAASPGPSVACTLLG